MSQTKAEKVFAAALEAAAIESATEAVDTGSLKSITQLKYEYNVVCCQHPECIKHFEMFSPEEAEELRAKGYDLGELEANYIHAEEESKYIEQFKGFDNPSEPEEEPVESVPPVPEEEPVEEKEEEVDSKSQSLAESFKLLDDILADITPLALPVITVLIANLTLGATYENALTSALACDDTVRNERD